LGAHAVDFRSMGGIGKVDDDRCGGTPCSQIFGGKKRVWAFVHYLLRLVVQTSHVAKSLANPIIVKTGFGFFARTSSEPSLPVSRLVPRLITIVGHYSFTAWAMMLVADSA